MIPPATATFCEQDIQRPLVYAWRRGDVVLYVGMSVMGLRRPFGRHHVLALEPGDMIDVWLCDSENLATTLEAQLIAAWRPQRNTIGNGAGLAAAAVALRRE